MDNFFKRKNIFIKFTILIALLFIVDNAALLIIGKWTEGLVIRYVCNNAGGSKYPSTKYPVIQFQINGKDHQFNGN